MPTGHRECPSHWRPETDSCACAPPSRARDGRFAHPECYGDALWYGIFDAAYTRPGDYLVQADSVWFIAAQQRLLPVLCVKTNRIVSFWRPAAPSSTGVNTYGGVDRRRPTNHCSTNWPASVLGASGRGRPSTDLPGDSSSPYWTVLLPAIPDVILLPSDLMTDDLGRNAVVAAAELTDLGLAHDDEAGDDLMADQSDVENRTGQRGLGGTLSSAEPQTKRSRAGLPYLSRLAEFGGTGCRSGSRQDQCHSVSRGRRQPHHNPIRRALDGRAAAPDTDCHG